MGGMFHVEGRGLRTVERGAGRIWAGLRWGGGGALLVGGVVGEGAVVHGRRGGMVGAAVLVVLIVFWRVAPIVGRLGGGRWMAERGQTVLLRARSGVGVEGLDGGQRGPEAGRGRVRRRRSLLVLMLMLVRVLQLRLLMLLLLVLLMLVVMGGGRRGWMVGGGRALV